MVRSNISGNSKPELRRDVSVWGSYMWGFADVGADTFVAPGLVMAYAQGATSLDSFHRPDCRACLDSPLFRLLCMVQKKAKTASL